MMRAMDIRRGFVALMFACAACQAQQAVLPAYTPAPLQPAVIRSWGDDAMRRTMTAWEHAFRNHHPEITFQDTLLGTATSMAGITTGTSDLSLMGRPVTVNEVIGFEWVFRVKPLGIQVMNGSANVEGRSPALAVLVPRSNPIKTISMAQLATVMGCPAAPKQPVMWSLAGATGTWKNKPVHVYLYDNQTGTGDFLQKAVQGKKDCWNWEIVREFKDKTHSNGSNDPAAQQIAEAVAADPNALGISTLAFAGPRTKALPIAASAPPVALTSDSIMDGSYPLARGVYIYINRAKDKPVDPKVAEFLRFILSREGQEIVRAQNDYVPLSPSVADAERKKLK
jgi:phosphate transport system substrate-binding protein